MRIADRQTARNYLKYLNTAKTEYAKTSERIESGNRFTRISDDVSAGTRALRTRVDKAKTEEYSDNVDSITEQLTTTEDAMTSINNILAEVHSKVLAALNGTSGESGNGSIAAEIESMRDELLQLANTKYDDMFVLGGTSADTAPFTTDNSGNLLYNGIDVDTIEQDGDGYYYMDGTDRKDIPMDGECYVDIGLGITMTGSEVKSDTAMQVSYSGLDILGCGVDSDGKSGNIYNVISDIVDNITDYNDDALGELDDELVSFTTNFRTYLTDIGSKTSFLDTISSNLDSKTDAYEEEISNLVGIDDAEEATTQSMNYYVLQAVLKIGSDILPTSLMDFIS